MKSPLVEVFSRIMDSNRDDVLKKEIQLMIFLVLLSFSESSQKLMLCDPKVCKQSGVSQMINT